MRYFAEIGYKGFHYHGWQRQPNVVSVQEVFEKCLTNVLGEPITCIGCGRTDAKVHASQFYFHFNINKKWDFDLVFRLNKMLPHDIAVFDIFEVDNNVHAQRNATQRTYNYFLHTVKNPFLNETSTLYPLEFDTSLMFEALSIIPNYSDFKNFCKCLSKHKNTLCRVSAAKIFVNDNYSLYRIEFSSNRFLQGMVRLLVNSILRVGMGNLSLEEFEDLLSNRTSNKNAKPAYPQGLYLTNVEYDFPINQPTKKHLTSITPLLLLPWKELKA